jgi:tRNA1Val (adenine37-N6)-methyltransferase
MGFTIQYEQPEDYHFSLDSVLAPEIVSQQNLLNIKNLKVLDLCAGVGVMGLELAYHLPNINEVTFVEVQNECKSYFEINSKRMKEALSRDINFNFFHMNYADVLTEQPQFKESFDLIITNPPYFRIKQGKLSPSEFKNRSRFFIDSTFQKLIEVIIFCLKKDGSAYLLIRNLDDHNINPIREIEIQFSNQIKITHIADVRGTHLVTLKKG